MAKKRPPRKDPARVAAAKLGWARRRKAEKEAAKKAAARKAKRREAAKLGWETRREQGDLAGLVITVYSVHWEAVLPNMVDFFSAIFRGSEWSPDVMYKGTLWFRRAISSATLARKLGRIRPSDIPNTFNGERVRFHLMAVTIEREYLPLARAYTDPEELLIQALDELANDLKKYRNASSARERRPYTPRQRERRNSKRRQRYASDEKYRKRENEKRAERARRKKER